MTMLYCPNCGDEILQCDASCECEYKLYHSDTGSHYCVLIVHGLAVAEPYGRFDPELDRIP